MGWKTDILPDALLRKLPLAERKRLGKAGVTQAEAATKADTRAERELQKDMENLLNQRGLWHLRSRMDRKTTVRCGVPDFLIILPGGKTIFVEAKVQGGKLSPEQETEIGRIYEKTGLLVFVVDHLQAFRELLDLYNPPTP